MRRTGARPAEPAAVADAPRSTSRGASTRRRASIAAALLALAFGVRIAFCGGLAVGDDVIYMAQAIAHGVGGAWPPEPGHWNVRLGVTLPSACSVALFGVHRWSLLVLPMAVGSLWIPAAWAIVRATLGERLALRSAVLLAFVPMAVIFSGHLFPDVLEGAFASLGLLCFLSALRDDRAAHYVAAGALLSAAYLCRETIVLQAPVLAVLLATSGRIVRPRLAWMLAVPLATLAAEAALFALTTGDALYRVHSVLAMVRDAENHALAERIGPGGGFWTAPLLMLVTSHEFGPFFALALPIALWGLVRPSALRPVAVWFVAGYVWTFYGTTDPADWFPLPRTPRYAMTLCVPAALLCAWGVERLPARARVAAIVALAALGSISARLDDGSSMVSPHRKFVASSYSAGASLDPAEYFAARWALGLERRPDFACASDLGRPGTVRCLRWLAGTRAVPHEEERFAVLSSQRETEVVDALRRAGWRQVAQMPVEVRALRREVGRILDAMSGQANRAWKLLHGPGLVVLENPARRADTSPPDR